MGHVLALIPEVVVALLEAGGKGLATGIVTTVAAVVEGSEDGNIKNGAKLKVISSNDR
jgi:hypothetical protein